MTAFSTHLNRLDRQLLLFICGTLAIGLSMGLAETSFNNFLSDTYDMDAETRGHLEFPRELPGFLVAVVAGALFFFSEIHVASLSMLLMAIGLVGLGFWGDQYGLMVGAMVIWSVGMHLQMPVTRSIALDMAKEGGGGTMLGRLGGVRTGAAIVGSGLLWMGLGETSSGYMPVFFLSAVVALAGGAFFLGMKPVEGQTGSRPKFIFNRKYTLFYILNILFGARKQVFITFGPWVLIKIFGEPVSTIAWLNVVASVFGMVLSPQFGRLIDRFGERLILMIDAFLLVWVCVGYGFAARLDIGAYALYIIYASFVLDQILFHTGIARTTYLNKIAEKKSDVTASLSLGVTIDHAVSMTIPSLGGLVWIHYGYEYVFLGAACIAALNFIAAGMVRSPSPESSRSGTLQAAG